MASSLDRPSAPAPLDERPPVALAPVPVSGSDQPTGREVTITGRLVEVFRHTGTPAFECVVDDNGRLYLVRGMTGDVVNGAEHLRPGADVSLAGTLEPLPGPPASLPDGKRTNQQIELARLEITRTTQTEEAR